MGEAITAPTLLSNLPENTGLYHGRELALNGLLATATNHRGNVLYHNFFLTLQY